MLVLAYCLCREADGKETEQAHKYGTPVARLFGIEVSLLIEWLIATIVVLIWVWHDMRRQRRK